MELKWGKYTKRRVNIHAICFEPTIEFCSAICKAAADSPTPAVMHTYGRYDDALPLIAGNMYLLDKPRLFIETLEGDMEVLPGDYIVIGTNGEYYPCKPIPFEQVHSPAMDSWTFRELTKETAVDIAEWIHGTDCSTIHGLASAYIHKKLIFVDTYQFLLKKRTDTYRLF